MASLTGSTIAASYEQLLSLPDGGLNGNTLVAVTDGDSSTAIGMKVATSKIEVIPASDDANAFEVSNAAGTAILTINSSTTSASLVHTVTTAASTPIALLVDANTSGVAAQNSVGMHVDFDRTVAGSGTAAHNDIGINLDVNSASLGTSSVIGMDIDVVGATGGTHTATGLTVDVGSSDTNYAALFNGGNVGVGTSAPQRNIHAYTAGDDAGIVIQVGNTTSNCILDMGDSDAIAQGGIRYFNTTDLMTIRTNNATVMTLLSTGNVGIGDTDPSEAKLSIDNVASGDVGIKLVQGQAQHGIFIDQNANNNAINIDAAGISTYNTIAVVNSATTGGYGLSMEGMNALTTGGAAKFATASTAMATTSASGFVSIVSTGNSTTNVNNLLYVHNDHASSSGTTCLRINQDANNEAIRIAGGGITTTKYINMEDATLTTGNLIQAYSNSSDSHSSRTRSLVKIVNDNAATDYATGLHIQQDGNGPAIEISGDGNNGIKFGGGASTDANTLDDYEEGYATMTFTSDSGTITANTGSDQLAYTKIGRIVHFQGSISVSAISSPTGWTRMVGLPASVASLNENAAYASPVIRVDGLASDSGVSGALQGYLGADTNWFYIQAFDGQNAHNISEHIGTSTSFVVSGTYIAA